MDLYDRMALFGKALSQPQREVILITSLYNDLRLYEDSPTARLALVQQFIDPQSGPYQKKFSGLKLDKQLHRVNWQCQISQASRYLSAIPGTKPLERSFVLNLWLFKLGFCPLIHFAFDQWYDFGTHTVNDKKLIDELADLSTTFLYRLVPVSSSPASMQLIGVGAYSNVYRSADEKTAFKVPRNLAALSFAHEEEYRAYNYAQNTTLADFLPSGMKFDKRSGVIERQYIEGTTGFKLLAREDFLKQPYGFEQLKEIFEAACLHYYQNRINFDIHPGNLMWSHPIQRWFLVDVGPMPEIGANYFPRHDFQTYFKKIWLSLYGLMATVPIRSLDIDMPAVRRQPITNSILDISLF